MKEITLADMSKSVYTADILKSVKEKDPNAEAIIEFDDSDSVDADGFYIKSEIITQEVIEDLFRSKVPDDVLYSSYAPIFGVMSSFVNIEDTTLYRKVVM